MLSVFRRCDIKQLQRPGGLSMCALPSRADVAVGALADLFCQEIASLIHPKTSRSVGVIFSKFLQSASFSKIHSYVARVFKKRIFSVKIDYFSLLVYQYAYMEYIRDPKNQNFCLKSLFLTTLKKARSGALQEKAISCALQDFRLKISSDSIFVQFIRF